MKAVLKLFLPLGEVSLNSNWTYFPSFPRITEGWWEYDKDHRQVIFSSFFLHIINCHRMDSNNDGMITYDEFVQSVKTSGDSDLYRWIIVLFDVSNMVPSLDTLSRLCLWGSLWWGSLSIPSPCTSGSAWPGLYINVCLYISVAWFVYLSASTISPISSSLPRTN